MTAPDRDALARVLCQADVESANAEAGYAIEDFDHLWAALAAEYQHQAVAALAHLAATGPRDAGLRDKELAEYLAQMDHAGGGIYTRDFCDGFRHALAMVTAFESREEPSPDRVRPEVREAARLALSRAAPDPGPDQGDGGTPCSTCGQPMDSPGCSTFPGNTSGGFHTVSGGGPGQPAPAREAEGER